MSIFETLVIFVGIPAVVIAVIAGLVYGGGARRARRYRPGRPFEFTPVWFLAAPERLQSGGGSVNGRALGGSGHRALSADADSTAETEAAARTPDVTGGASDRW